jgi:hypothetical protein
MKPFLKIAILFFLLLYTFGVAVRSQDLSGRKAGAIETVPDEIFNLDYFQVNAEKVGLEFTIPKGFQVADSIRIYKDTTFRPIEDPSHKIVSNDQQCLVVISIPHLFTRVDSIRAVAGKKNYTVKYINSIDSTDYFFVPATDFNQYSSNIRHWYFVQKRTESEERILSYYSDMQAKTLFNADSVLTYYYPIKAWTNSLMKVSFREKYPHREVIVIHKHDRGFAYLTCYFTDEGIKKKKRYIQSLSQILWYKHEK